MYLLTYLLTFVLFTLIRILNSSTVDVYLMYRNWSQAPITTRVLLSCWFSASRDTLPWLLRRPWLGSWSLEPGALGLSFHRRTFLSSVTEFIVNIKYKNTNIKYVRTLSFKCQAEQKAARNFLGGGGWKMS